MSFILVSDRGDLQVNAWNWRPTLEMLRAANVVTQDHYERLGASGAGGRVDAVTARHIADVIDGQLAQMKPGEQMLTDLTVASRRAAPVGWTANADVQEDTHDLYSAWL